MRRFALGLGLWAAASLPTFAVGCFGKLDTTDSGQAPGDTGNSRDTDDGPRGRDGDDDGANGDSADGLVEPLPNDGQMPAPLGGPCPPSQWDCSGVVLSCRIDELGYSYFTPHSGCKCDFSRPDTGAWDDANACPTGQRVQCGSLDAVPPDEPDALSCLCVPNAGYYCSTCPSLGLYTQGLAVDCTLGDCGCR